MQFNWSTFVLEIINFVVLVWILKHFLYRPVLSLLEKRREKIEQSLSAATERHNQATRLGQQYQQRLEEWAREKQQLLDDFQQQMQTERGQRLQQLQAELASERKKSRVVEQRQQAEILSRFQLKAHQQGARFASRLLTDVASQQLETRLFELLIASMDALDKARLDRLLNACGQVSTGISVTSAYPLSKEKQQQLADKLETLCKQPVTVDFAQDSELIAGLRILIGSVVLGLNLQDELKGFVELAGEN